MGLNDGRRQRRVSVLDTVDERSHKLARSRTALVRIGKVKAVLTANSYTVTVGGGDVPARGFVGSTYAVANIVCLVTDTDAWWILGRLS